MSKIKNNKFSSSLRGLGGLIAKSDELKIIESYKEYEFFIQEDIAHRSTFGNGIRQERCISLHSRHKPDPNDPMAYLDSGVSHEHIFFPSLWERIRGIDIFDKIENGIEKMKKELDDMEDEVGKQEKFTKLVNEIADAFKNGVARATRKAKKK